MPDPDYLFVYGTLLAVAQHPMGDLLQQKARLVGPGTIQAKLYRIDDPDAPGENYYPGAVPSGKAQDVVHGEVHEVLDPAGLYPKFDAFEACSDDWPEPHEFMLRRVSVRMAGGPVWAHSYLYTWDVTQAQPIRTGRYTEVSPSVR